MCFPVSPPPGLTPPPPGCRHAAEDVVLAPVLGDAAGRRSHLDDGACDGPGQEEYGGGHGEQSAAGHDGGCDDDLREANTEGREGEHELGAQLALCLLLLSS